MTIKAVRTVDQFREVIRDDKPTIAVFKANWCADCTYISPFMPKVVEKFADRLQFIEVDSDELRDIVAEYHILGIPSFIAFKQGKELIRFVSKLRKTQVEIEHFLERAHAVAEVI